MNATVNKPKDDLTASTKMGINKLRSKPRDEQLIAFGFLLALEIRNDLAVGIDQQKSGGAVSRVSGQQEERR